jgi:hypothetical protein
MHFKAFLLLFSAASLFACSSTPESQQLSFKPVEQKGFSLSLPDQEKWAVVKKTPYIVEMASLGKAYDDRYTIQVLVIKLPKFKRDKDFMKFVTKRMKKSQKKSGVKIIDQHAQFIDRENKKCVQYNSKKQFSGKTKPVLLETASFTCRHPDRENAGIYLAYSKKYSQGNDDKFFNDNASDIFNHMKIAMF